MPESRLSPSQGNKFQVIKTKIGQAQAQGVDVIKLGIGQPAGAPFGSFRCAAAAAMLLTDQEVHEYQDNGSAGVVLFDEHDGELIPHRNAGGALIKVDFAQMYVNAHQSSSLDVSVLDNIAYLPTCGTKPTLLQVLCACEDNPRALRVGVPNTPNYPTFWYWAEKLGCRLIPVDMDNLEIDLQKIDILADISPGNPTGGVRTHDWYRKVFALCVKNGVRFMNDAAYIALAEDGIPTAMEVAVEFPDLSWVELYSASKQLGNTTGARVGALVGSSDFVGDIAKIKGETDSGFNAAIASGVLHATLHDKKSVNDLRNSYLRNLRKLAQIIDQEFPILELYAKPQAGFFLLFDISPDGVARLVQGVVNKDTLGELLNNFMILNHGIAGVPFGSQLRYSVAQIEIDKEVEQRLRHGFREAMKDLT
jgi:aspartate/methionine/tyrosine aminotransferase